MFYADLVATVLLAVLTYISYPIGSGQQFIFIFLLQLGAGTALIASTCLMRRAVNSISFVKPNDFLVMLHVVSFTILLTLSLICALVQVTDMIDKSDIYIAVTLQYFVANMTSATLDILLARFILHKNRRQKLDPILGKKVNPIVFLQNQNLTRRELS